MISNNTIANQIGKIEKLSKKKATVEEIQDFLHITDYLTLTQYINQQVKLGTLTPVNSSKFNGKTPPLYRSYHMRPKQEDTSSYRDELLYHLAIIYEGLR